MFEVTNEMIALAAVFAVCMVGVAYHTIATSRLKREHARKRDSATRAPDHAQAAGRP
jgi:predicted membrane channel-forming protein YqfA (hemolysin III family)